MPLSDKLQTVFNKTFDECTKLIQNDLEDAGFEHVKITLPCDQYDLDFSILIIEADYKLKRYNIEMSHSGYTYYIKEYNISTTSGKSLIKRIDQIKSN